LVEAAPGEPEEGVDLGLVERLALGGALELDVATVLGPDAVHVGVGRGVLQVVEVEPRGASDDADAHRRHLVAQRFGGAEPGLAVRWRRVRVGRGSIAYSAVTQPSPLPLR